MVEENTRDCWVEEHIVGWDNQWLVEQIVEQDSLVMEHIVDYPWGHTVVQGKHQQEGHIAVLLGEHIVVQDILLQGVHIVEQGTQVGQHIVV